MTFQARQKKKKEGGKKITRCNFPRERTERTKYMEKSKTWGSYELAIIFEPNVEPIRVSQGSYIAAGEKPPKRNQKNNITTTHLPSRDHIRFVQLHASTALYRIYPQTFNLPIPVSVRVMLELIGEVAFLDAERSTLEFCCPK